MSLSTEVESTMSIRSLPVPNIYVCRYMTNCDWCSKRVRRGHQINMFAPKQFTSFLRDLLTIIAARKRIPIGVSILISTFLFRSPQQYYIDNNEASQPFRLAWPTRLGVQDELLGPFENRGGESIALKEAICLDCCFPQQYVTRAGRVSTKPYNKIINTVPGSGFSGCDHYDHSFDGDLKEIYQDPLSTANLKDFILSDKELTSQHAVMECMQKSDDEEELSDYETEESDYDGPCWSDSEDED